MQRFCFVITLVLLCLVKPNEGSCEIIPNDVDKLTVKVFYTFNEKKWDASSKLITTVCENHDKFGDKMKVEFHIIARIWDDNGYPECDSSEVCGDELSEVCAEKLSADPMGFACCVKEFEDCMKDSGVALADLIDCLNKGYNSDAGRVLLNSRKALENDAGIDEGPLPALVFNNEKYHKCTDNSAYDNFVWTVCQMYKPEIAPKPPC